MAEWSGLVRVDLPRRAVFGLVVEDGKVVDCAPYARRSSLGLPIEAAASYWRALGARVDAVASDEEVMRSARENAVRWKGALDLLGKDWG